jgi:oligopeptide transport system substrate-binding protein
MKRGSEAYRINRRQLIGGLALAGPGIVMHSVSSSRESTWRPSDGLRLAGPITGLETLDPALSRDNQTNFLVRQIVRGLMGYDEQLLPVPELAASVEVSPDQATYTFTLRDDARFHDGRQVEAEDVAWSLARALNPETAAAAGLSLMGTTFLGDIAGADDVLAGNADQLSGVDVPEPGVVRIALQGPSTTFLMRLASVPGSILDRHQDTSALDWWRSINGSGPYRVSEVDPASRLEMTAVESWRGESIAVQDARVRLGLEASAPENLIQSGDIDLIDNAYAGMVPLLVDPAVDLPGYRLYEGPQFSLCYIALGGQEAPLDDIHIRRALQLGFDTTSYVSAALGDTAIAPQGVIPDGVLGRAWRGQVPRYYPVAAREEIAASRYGSAGNVPPIRIHAADTEPVEAMRETIGRDLGLTIEVIKVNWGDFLTGLSGRLWDAYSVFWTMDYPDPESLLRMLWSSASADNYTGYSNEAFDAVLDESKRVADDNIRHDLYMEAQQILIDDVAVIPLYVPRRYTFARPGFTELPVTPTGILGLERIR